MSITNFLFNDPVTKMTKKHMDLLVRRSELVAGNLANADTPGYKARDINFKEVLEKIASGGSTAPRTANFMARTNPKHLPVAAHHTTENVEIIEKDSLSVDQNSVNMEDEMRKANEISLLFDFTSTYLKRKSNLLNSAIKGT